ncbi:MAG: hypothetical protein PHD95_04620 [Candidatus ainarchaeum sp.]|nr:hypothetical protein [Candidatus ainarchaeum sp.]
MKAQGSLEYLLIIGGAIVVSAVVIVSILGIANLGPNFLPQQITDIFGNPLNQTTPGTGPQQFHYDCINSKCIQVNGAGINKCNPAILNCTIITCTDTSCHTTCQNLNCVQIHSPGTNQCTTNADCNCNNQNISLSGFVKQQNNNPVPDIELAASNNGGNTASNANGFYLLPETCHWSGSLTPSSNDWNFTPSSRIYANLDSNLIDQNFVAIPLNFFEDHYDNLNHVDPASFVNITGENGIMHLVDTTDSGEINPADWGSSLVGLWHLDGNASDSSGNNNNGTISGNPIFKTGSNAIFGQALDFDGTGDRISVNNSASINSASGTGQARTWAYWIFYRGGNNTSITDKTNGFAGKHFWSESQTDYIRGGVNTDQDNPVNSPTLTTNQWYHLAFTYDGSQARLYLNGNLVDGPKTQTATADNTNNLFLMADSSIGAETSGILDEFAVWNRALSDAEIQGIANAAGTPTGSFESTEIPINGTIDSLTAQWDTIIENNATIEISFDNGAHWCTVSNGQTITNSNCPSINSDFKYKAMLEGSTALHKVRFNWAKALPAVCGNETIETGEICDPPENTQTCTTSEGYTGTQACNSTCTGWNSCTSTQYCGDGQLNGTEACDGSNLNSQTCVTQGFTGGTLDCNANCTFNTSQCTVPTCGDGIINGTEQCDGSNLNGQTCQSLGYSGGTLTCTGCSYNTSQCTAPSFTMPIGIPNATFGLNEQAPAYNQSTSNHYYVDKSSPSCNDSGNSGRGSPATPRCTIPTNTLSAGSLVEIHGGPYTGTNINLSGNGSAVSPVFIRGASSSAKPVFRPTYSVIVSGSYIILENIDLDGWSAESNDTGISLDSVHHIALRNLEVHNGPDATTSAISLGGTSGQPTHDILIYNSAIHDNGDWQVTTDQDHHGSGFAAYVKNIWILNSQFYHNSGDGIQITNGNDPCPLRETVHDIFIGNNTAWENKQTGFWVKCAVDVVFSQNTSYAHMGGVNGDGTGIGGQYQADRIWFLFNKAYGNGRGVATGEITDGTMYFIGNLSYDNDTGFNSWGPATRYLINNTIVDNPYGLDFGNGNGTNYFINNIFTGTLDGEDKITENLNNLFGTTATMKFVNSGLNDYHLQPISPARNTGSGTGTVQSVFSTYQSRFGVDIKKDLDAITRPQEGTWDIGAFEYHT